MKRLTHLLLIIMSFCSYSQNNRVPFRVGDLFGISDSSGKVKITPKYDVIDIEGEKDKFFIGYNLKANTSTLIYKDKEILSNTAYQYFFIENDLIVATKYGIPKRSYYGDDDSNDIKHLYTIQGKPIIAEDCAFIYIIENVDEIEKSNEALIFFKTQDKKYSLVLYNKKLGKISKTYFDKTNYCDVIYNFQYNPTDKSITFIYLNKSGQGKKINLINQSKGITHFTEENYDIKQNKNKDNDLRNYDDTVMMIDNHETRKKIMANDSIILTWRKIAIQRDFYYKPKQKEKVSTNEEKINEEWAYIIKKNNKVGLRLIHNNSLAIPIEYDEILNSEFRGQSSCYLLRKGNKYGASIKGFDNDLEIKPIFEKLFLVEDVNYFGKKIALLKLYNDDGTFYAYAKSDGTIFIK